MKDWIEKIQARTEAQAKYDKKNTTGVYLKLNMTHDKDIIQWLRHQPNKQGAIKDLIREKIKKDM